MNISIYRSTAGQYENLRSVNKVPMMNAISHSIEEQVINHALPVNFYAGFERLSRFPAQTLLYGRLGAAARRVYIFLDFVQIKRHSRAHQSRYEGRVRELE